MTRPRYGLLTGGGDCPGLNAVIRTVSKMLMKEHRAEIIGIQDGYEGLIEGRWRTLSYDDVSGIFTRPGTILGTSNKAIPYDYEGADRTSDVVRNYRRLGLEALFVTGGDGTLTISHRMSMRGLKIVGIPKTIDNDIFGTDVSFGFQSAMQVGADALESLHATADAHSRVMIVEIMGRDAGWLALESGVAAAADVILIPEIPFRLDRLAQDIRNRHKRRRFTIISVAEGAHAEGADPIRKSGSRLGGIAQTLAELLEPLVEHECRTMVLGHLQRSAKPTAMDRLLAVQFSRRAVELAHSRQFGRFAAMRNGRISDSALSTAARGRRTVPPDYWLVQAAREVGTSFGI